MVGPAEIRNARILIVDDSSVNVLLLTRMLREAGYTSVTSTTDPTSVAALYREVRHDLILLDLLMPDMDGFQVMEELQGIETDGYLPILVLTAQPAHQVQALRAGARDFVSKPFDRVEVLTRIEHMLEVRLLLHESRSYGRQLEHYDQLTGLPNRRLFRDRIIQALRRDPPSPTIVSVLFVAIDHFSTVSNALGRSAGGAMLKLLAERLVSCAGATDTTARLEGDKFGIVVESPGDDPLAAGLVALRVRNALLPPLEWEGQSVAVTASVGIAVAPTDAADADLLMQYANTALRAGQMDGRDSYTFFTPEMNVRAVRTVDLEAALQHALKRGEFVLHYQPKMRIDTGEWTGMEALLRWDRPGHAQVPPSDFIPILEETGLIVAVGDWVIDSVCRQIAAWAPTSLGGISIAVNVSGRQFLREGFVESVARALKEHKIRPGALDIEITESSLISRTEETNAVLRELKALGVWIAIDDFGTGFSSLSRLKRFPIDTLKIDISFIRDVTTSPEGASIALAIINLARSLNMRVIAEGVETRAQLDFLRANACDEIQGYYLSRPLPALDLAALREAHDASRRQEASPPREAIDLREARVSRAS